MAELDTRRIAAHRTIEITWTRDVRMTRGSRIADDLGLTQDELLDRHVRIGGDGDEGRIGAVLEQPADQVSQQIAMLADRRVGPAGDAGVLLAQRGIKR